MTTLRDCRVEMFLRRLRRLVSLKRRGPWVGDWDGNRLILWAIYSTRQDLVALGARAEADALIGR
jgi:hypothetical protein